jgi:hypothetical protein
MSESARPAPRIWPALTALFLAVPATVAVQIPIFLAYAAVIVARDGGDGVDHALENFSLSPLGFLLALVSSQAVFAVAACVPARLSPVPFAERLGLRRPGLSFATWLLMLVGAIFALQLGEMVLLLAFDEPSEALTQMARVFIDAPLVVGLILVASASILPGLCEELLCRGYVQRRLLRRWPPLIAVTFTSVVFAGMHVDPQHVLGVLPLALWLGYVAWRADSTWPSIACHFFINAFAQASLLFARPEELEATAVTFPSPWLLITALPFAGAIYMLEGAARARR